MLSQEGELALGELGLFRRTAHPSRNGSFRNIESEHQQFTMNARCAPGRILCDHPEDEIANFLGDSISSHHSTRSGDGAPIERESSSMPADNGLGAHDDEGLIPTRPEFSRENPEELVKRSNAWPRMLAFEHRQLLPKN